MLICRPLCLVALALSLEAICPGASARGANAIYLPDETEVVLTINLKQLRSCELIKGEKSALEQFGAILNRLTGDVPVLKCLRDCKLDVTNDLTRITFAGPHGKEIQPRFLVLEGDFTALKLDSVLAATARTNPNSLKISTSGDITIYEIAVARRRNYAALVNKTTLLAATTRESLTDAFARASGAKKSRLAKGLRALLDATNDKQSLSVVASGTALSALLERVSLPNAETAIAALKLSEGASAAVTLTKVIQFQIGIHAQQEETAKNLADASDKGLLGLRTLVRQKAREDKKLLPLIEVADTLRIKSEGPIIFLRGEATLDAVEKLLK